MKRTFLPGVARKEGTPTARSVSEDRWEVALSDRTPGKKSDKPDKNLGGPTRLILTTLLIFLASQLIAAFIAELGLAIIRPGSHQALDNSVAAQFVYILFAEGLAAFFVIRIVKKRGLKLAAIGLGRRPVK